MGLTLYFLRHGETQASQDRISMPVTSISIVEMPEQGPLLKVLGDRSYLRESLRMRFGM